MKISRSNLTVIMTALNASRTIGLALISVCLFMPKGTKVLVYLDGGTTNSRVMDYLQARGRVDVFHGKQTLGVFAGLNYLIPLVKTEFVARLDADDLALPFYHSKAIRLIRNRQCDVVFANAIEFGLKMKFPFFFPQPTYPIRIHESPTFLTVGNPFVHPTMLCRTETLVECGGYVQCAAEDYELWLRLVLAGVKLRRLARFGALYRVHAAQVTNENGFSQRVEMDPCISRLRNRLIEALGHAKTSESQMKVAEVLQTLAKGNLGFRASARLHRFFTKQER